MTVVTTSAEPQSEVVENRQLCESYPCRHHPDLRLSASPSLRPPPPTPLNDTVQQDQGSKGCYLQQGDTGALYCKLRGQDSRT